MERKDCPTCTALERAETEGKLDIYVNVGEEGSGFPPEVSTLESLADDGNLQLNRCRDCGTLYRYWHFYEYDAYGPSYDEYHLGRVEDAVTAVVAPLFEPLAPDALDDVLARALRSQSAEVRRIAALALHSAPEERSDTVLHAAAEGLAAVDSDVTIGCYNALLAAFRGRGAARARAVRTVLAGLGEDVYGVRALRSLCQEELDAAPPAPARAARPAGEELDGKSVSELEAEEILDPNNPEFGTNVCKLFDAANASGAEGFGKKIALLSFLAEYDLAPALPGFVVFHPEPHQLLELVDLYGDDPQVLPLVQAICEYEVRKYPKDGMVQSMVKVQIQSAKARLEGFQKFPEEAEGLEQSWRSGTTLLHVQRPYVHELFRLIAGKAKRAPA